MQRIMLGLLPKTRNGSAPGPDGICWRSLTIIRNAKLGKAVLADMAEVGTRYSGEPECEIRSKTAREVYGSDSKSAAFKSIVREIMEGVLQPRSLPFKGLVHPRENGLYKRPASQTKEMSKDIRLIRHHTLTGPSPNGVKLLLPRNYSFFNKSSIFLKIFLYI